MNSDSLDLVEATDAWRRDLRQHSIAFVQADDLAKQYRSQLKPVSQTIKETRENVIALLESRGVPKCEISELGASLKVVKRPTKKAPTQAEIRNRCRTFFEMHDLAGEDPELAGERLYDHLSRKDTGEGVFLRRGTIGKGKGKAAAPALLEDDVDDDEELPELGDDE